MSQIEFGTVTDKRNGKSYKTVKIGNQTWLAENLAYMPAVYPGRKEGGIWVYGYYGQKGLLGAKSDTDKAKTSKYYMQFGCLYDYDTALTISPSGWHLPSHDEWSTLEMHLGMDLSTAESYDGFRGTDEGKRLKAKIGWKEGGNGSDELGFHALPGGYHGYDKGVFSKTDFREVGISAHFWTSDDTFQKDAVYRSLRSGNNKIAAATCLKQNGLSVRCVKDDV